MRCTLVLVTLASVFCLAQAHRCPPRGNTRRESSRSDCGYSQCNNGSGRRRPCPEGHYFSEQKQCCVPRYTRSSSGKSNSKPSSGSGSNGKRPPDNGGGKGSSGGNGGGGGGGGVSSDYHWRR